MKKYLPTFIRLVFLALFILLIQNGKMMLWFGIYAFSLILALIFGRIYCGYICPMNTLMIPTDKIAKKLKFQTDKMPKWLQSGKISWIAIFVSLAVMIFTKRIMDKNIPILLIWLGISVVITIRYKPSIFHNLICPFGPLQKIFGRFTRFSENVYKEGCIGCYKCEKVCPSEAILVNKEDKKAEIDRSLCHQCTNCVQVCPTDTISYSNLNKRPNTDATPL